MLKILGIVLGVVVLAVAGIAAYAAATQPNEIRIERSIEIAAPADRIFPLINDFRRWGEWSPYEKKDPDMRRTFGGAENGKGARYAWEGDSSIGSGNMEITQSVPNERIAIDLHFTSPMEANNVAEFTMRPNGQRTQVTWVMQGPMNLFGKVASVFMDMDKMVGDDFAAGLRNMKALAEK